MIPENEIREKFGKYIVSIKLPEVVYLLWGTDMEDEQDKLLINHSDKILAFKTVKELIAYVNKGKIPFKDKENVAEWVRCEDAQQPYADFDLVKVKSILENNSIEMNNLQKDEAATLLDFYNLFSDYVYQLNQENLFELINTNSLKVFFDYVYNSFFWKKEENPPQMNFDQKQFKRDYNLIIDYFQKHLMVFPC